MSATSYGWLVLAFPLAGTLIISFGWLRGWPARWPGWIASGAILGAFLSSIGALIKMQDRPEDARSLVDSAWTYVSTAASTSACRSWSTRCRCSCAWS